METTEVKLDRFTGRRHQTAAGDDDDVEDRRLVSAVLSSVVTTTQLLDNMRFGRASNIHVRVNKTDEHNKLKDKRKVKPLTAVMKRKPSSTDWETNF